MPLTVDYVIRRAAEILNDFNEHAQHVRWSKAVLAGHLNEALQELSVHRPDVYAEGYDMKLAPGTLQKVPEGYRQVLAVEHNVNADGTAGARVSRSDDNFARLPTRRGTETNTPTTGYVVSGFGTNPIDDTVFSVTPAVPANTTAIVRVLLVREPIRHQINNLAAPLGIPDRYEAQVMDWMLMRCYESDIESQHASAAATRHRTHFYAALNAKRTNESYFNIETAEGENAPMSTSNRRLQTSAR